MYQTLLTRRYLIGRVMPLLAILAVVLCTAMVLIVWSVMAGFLNMLLAQGRALMGDVVVNWPVEGIPYYQQLIEDLENDPLCEAAAPTIEAPGLMALPEPGGTRLVQIVGVDGPSYDRVTNFNELLWWQPIDEALPKDTDERDLRLRVPEQMRTEGLTLREFDPETEELRSAVVTGVWVSGFNRRNRAGFIDSYYTFFPTEEVTVSVLPLSDRGAVIDVAARRFPVANEFQTGLYDADANSVLIELGALQEMLHMDAAERIEDDFDYLAVTEDDDGEENFAQPTVVAEDPARVTSILLRAAEGVTPAQLRDRAKAIYAEFDMKMDGEVPPSDFVKVETWEERPAVRTFIGAVKKEMALLLSLFGFISMTAAFLVCAIFWAMVSEKTRDIGILRAVGASKGGVAWLFLRYGLVIGFVGSMFGLAVSYAIVLNINPIHEWLGQALGIYVWDPEIYHFTRIPSEIEPLKASYVFIGGVLFSLIGAAIPAINASRLDPVRALRFE